MLSKIKIKLALACGSIMIAPGAMAHAQLEQAVPAVGGKVQASPAQLMLRFTEGIEPRLSSVTLAAEHGGAVPVGRLGVAPSNASVVTVKIVRALKPGTYVVNWRVISVDSHRTQGRYNFTVGP